MPISALLSFGPHATAAFPRGGAGLFLPAPPQQYRGAGRPRVYVPCLLIARERERVGLRGLRRRPGERCAERIKIERERKRV